MMRAEFLGISSDVPSVRGLRLLVGVQGAGLSGVETYGAQVAATAVQAGHDVTLLTTSPAVAEALRQRLDPRVRVVDLGLEDPGGLGRLVDRLWHGIIMRRLQRGMQSKLRQLGERFDVAHLNHPALAPAVRPHVQKTFVAAWFYPHAPLARMVETWRHTRGSLPRRVVLTVKSLSYYLGDMQGYRAADVVVCPTRLLAGHLQAKGFETAVCPPPVRLHTPVGQAPVEKSSEVVQLMAVSTDLSHPRKGMRDVLEAVRLMQRRGQRVRLVMVGRNPQVLEAQARSLPSDVEVLFTGPLPQDKVHAHLRQAQVLLFPSLYEEWGYAAVEALLAGVPVVTYPVYPFKYMLEGGLGIIAERRTPESLARATEQALRDSLPPEGLAELSAERFGSEAVGRRLTELWQGALAGGNQAAVLSLEHAREPGGRPLKRAASGVPWGR